MQYQHIGYRIKGFYRLYHYAVKYGMDNKQAHTRHKILNFWQTHGIDATLDAFNISRKTLYNWRTKRDAGGVPALAPVSKAQTQRV